MVVVDYFLSALLRLGLIRLFIVARFLFHVNVKIDTHALVLGLGCVERHTRYEYQLVEEASVGLRASCLVSQSHHSCLA